MAKIVSPNNLNDVEAQALARSQGYNTVVTISHLPDGSTSIMAFLERN